MRTSGRRRSLLNRQIQRTVGAAVEVTRQQTPSVILVPRGGMGADRHHEHAA